MHDAQSLEDLASTIQNLVLSDTNETINSQPKFKKTSINADRSTENSLNLGTLQQASTSIIQNGRKSLYKRYTENNSRVIDSNLCKTLNVDSSL